MFMMFGEVKSHAKVRHRERLAALPRERLNLFFLRPRIINITVYLPSKILGGGFVFWGCD
jgi:hypothetical protein